MYLRRPMPLIKVKNKFLKRRCRRIAFALGGLLACFTMAGQVQELYLKGIALADQGAYPEARKHLTEALTYDGSNGDCLLQLAEVCNRSGDQQAALEYLQRLEVLEPGRGSYLLATIHANEGDAGQAVRYLESHLKSPYKLPSYRILLDDSFSAIEDDPQWKALWSRDWYSEDEEFLQEVHYLTGAGDYLHALEVIESRLDDRFEWDALQAALGNVLLEMGQYQGAVQAYSRAIEISSANPSHYYGRAQAYMAQKKYGKAIPDLERAYRMEPEKLELIMEAGLVHYKAGQLGKAAASVERYLGYYPDDTEARYLSGQIYFDSGKYLDALEQFNACLRLEKGDPRFFAARGKTYLETGTYQYALNDLGMALDLDPNDHEVWFLRGQARWQMNDPEGAVGDWERAARLGSFDATVKLEEHARRK